MSSRRRQTAGEIGFTDSNLMPIAATFVVLIYLGGVISRWESAPWYEWLGAVAGSGGAIWFWVWDWMQSRRQRRRDEDDSGDDRAEGR